MKAKNTDKMYKSEKLKKRQNNKKLNRLYTHGHIQNKKNKNNKPKTININLVDSDIVRKTP